MNPAANINVVLDTDTSYGREVLRGVSAYAHEVGHWLLRVRARRFLEGPLDPSDAGLIVQSLSVEISRKVKDAGIPAVNVGDGEWGHPLPSVISDHQQIGRLAAEYLLTRGFAHLGFVGQANHWYAQQRREGFVREAGAAGFPVRELSLPERPPASAMHAWLAELSFPAGVMAANDSLASSLAYECQAMNIKVPAQVAIIGVDNDVIVCESAPVTLSSVAIGAQRIGYDAAALLDQMLAGHAPPAAPIVIPPSTVVPRKSTDTLAVQDPYVSGALRFIQANVEHPLTVTQLAEHLGVGRRYLQKTFEQLLNRAPVTEIRLARLRRAKELLSSTDLPVKRVATACGFADSASFSRFFQRETALSPSSYRQQFRLSQDER
jgi:LacI family transcriptional regulator